MNLRLEYGLLALVVGLLPQAIARANDIKPVSPAVCQAYDDGKPIDPAVFAMLSIRPDGITNYFEKKSLSVICPLPKDFNGPWTGSIPEYVLVRFRKDANDFISAPITQNKCTLSIGSYYGQTFKFTTRSATDIGDPNPQTFDHGMVSFANGDMNGAGPSDPATLVCEIATGHTLEQIFLSEIEWP